MLGRKKKKEQIEEIKIERFHIPQMDYGSFGLLKKRERFEKSKVASPFHGSNILDKTHFIDNNKSENPVNVDYGYDFVRENKHISDEELIARHGTKYYEFTMIKPEDQEDMYAGADYSKEKEIKPKEMPKKPFSFVEDADEIIETDISKEIELERRATADLDNDEEEFKLSLDIDESDNMSYNKYNNNMPKPSQTNIPSFLSDGPNKNKPEENLDDFDITEDISFDELPNMQAPDIQFSNPAVDKSLTIEEAMAQMNKDTSNVVVPSFSQPIDTPEAKPIAAAQQSSNNYDDYEIPYQDLFKTSNGIVDESPQWLEEKKEAINEILVAFGIDGEVINYTKGPAFTRYEVLLAPGVDIKKVPRIYDNIKAELRAKTLSIQAPIPGKNTVGIEVPNDVAEAVNYGDIINDDFINDGKPLRVALGKDIDGNTVYQNITDMPHALIAGATQSGKSVSVNTLIVSLLLKNSPENLRLILVDPKMVEFNFYDNLPHLATPVINDPVLATEAFKWAVNEMERRYEVLKRARVRNIGDYNKKRATDHTMENMPFIVIIVDEFNDLVMQCGNEINDCITRLAQKARAAGLHIILATQRPTADVVTGTIKGNIPCRIAFRVAAEIDSRIILDESGAENLLGRGDMIIKGNSAPIRCQGAYISDDEITECCEYILERWEPEFLFTHEDLKAAIIKAQGGGGNVTVKEADNLDDKLLYDVALASLRNGVCSINSIQTGFGVGFNKAQRIVNALEEREIVSPKNGTKPREILVDEHQLNVMFGVDDFE